MDVIPFLVEVPEDPSLRDVKSFLTDARHVALREIPVSKLRENLAKVSNALMQVLMDIKSVGDFELSEVEVKVEISAEGGVQFIGSSKIVGKGAIGLKFTRPK